MGKIIALWGKGNVGKTQTIKNAYALLISKYPTVLITHQISETDIRAIVEINGIKIGFESQGDPSSRLFESIEFFVKNECNIIICATRTRGATVDLIELQEPNYQITWHEQVVVSNKRKQSPSNLKMANKIIAEAINIINT